jgi:hypothetical protein
MNKKDRKFFLDKLDEQRHLLRKSVKDMTAGDLAEAIRVATVVRTLIHETGNSKPLLKYLNGNYLELPILDEAPKKKEATPHGVLGTVVLSIPIGFQIKPEGTFLNADRPVEGYAPSSLGTWWQRPSLILPGLGGFSRREIVLGLANKEGGAHIDPDVSKRYQSLLDNKSFQVGYSKEQLTPLNLSRLMAGQAGFELLDCLDKNFPTAN